MEKWNYLSLRRLSPRQRVLFFYLAMARRAAERGLGRHKAQTPLEFERTLRSSLPEVEADLKPLTETFVQARYSFHDVTDERANLACRWWLGVRRALKR